MQQIQTFLIKLVFSFSSETKLIDFKVIQKTQNKDIGKIMINFQQTKE